MQLEQQVGANVFTIGYVGLVAQHLPESINNINQPLPFNIITNPDWQFRPLDATFQPTARNFATWAASAIWPAKASPTTTLCRHPSSAASPRASLSMQTTHGPRHWATSLASPNRETRDGATRFPPTSVQTEYGISEDDIQNRFALSLNYELQFGKNFTGVKKFAFSNWQTNMITVWQSGKPFTIINGGSGADQALEADGSVHGYSNRAVPQNSGGNDRPDTIKNPRLGHKTLTEFFDTSAFAPQTLGTIGNTQRNSLFGPNFRHVDLSVFKTFPIKEGLGVQFRAECYNISNTPNFFIANNNSGNQTFGNAAFGTISATDPNYTPRQYQFALKVMF